MMLRGDVWLIKRKRKRGDTWAVRWIDPTTGKMRCESCGHDKKLGKDFASRKREELRRGINNDPIDVPWDEFAANVVNTIETQKSSKYADDVRRALDLFAMVCSPRGPLAVNYEMGQRFINTRLRGAKRCPRRACAWPNTLDRATCWKCGRDIAGGRLASMSPHTVNKNLRTLRAVFRDAMKRYRLPNHPLAGVADVEAQPKVIRALKLDEQRKVLNACPDLRWRAFCYLAITTGLRRGELCSLGWDDVDLDTRTLRVHHTKAKRNRTARLTEEAVHLLRQLRLTHAGPEVFRGDSGRGFYEQVGQGIAKIVVTAGIPRFTFHDLRRTFCTDLARGGVNQKVTSQLAGHASLRTTAEYYQTVDVEMADAAIATLPLVRTKTA